MARRAPDVLGAGRRHRRANRDAVAAAHAQGIVHRDLKPENIVLQPMADGTDVVKVLDFGIAKYARDSLVPPPVRGAQHVTRLGVVVGTPGYMAPEQAVGMRADHRADLYAIGVLLWECVVGQRLWDYDDIQQMLTAQLGSRPPLVRAASGDPSMPEAFEALVAALLATRPEHRPQTAVETRDQLRALVDAERRGSQPRLDLPWPPIEQPRLIVVTPPPDTSTVFIEAALARWRANAASAQQATEYSFDDEPPTTRLFVPAEAVQQPATQVGFRGAARVEPSAESSNAVASDERPLAAERETADDVAVVPRTSLRLYIALPLALAGLSLMLWAALAPNSSTARFSTNAVLDAVSTSRAAMVAPALHSSASNTANTPVAAPEASSLQPASTTPTSGTRTPLQPRRAGVPAPASSGHEHADALRAKARTYFRHADFELAAQTYRLAIKAAPGYSGAYAGLGASQLALGDAHGAVASYKQAIRRSPASSGFHAALGRAWLMAGNRSSALAEYRKAVALDPANEVAFRRAHAALELSGGRQCCVETDAPIAWAPALPHGAIRVWGNRP